MTTRFVPALVCACALLGTSVSFAQSSEASEGTVPLASLISDMAKRTGKRFVVDPRARADVMLIQKQGERLSYAEFLTVLQVHGFAAVEEGDLVKVVPDMNVRNLALPVLRDKDTRPDAEYVTKVIAVRRTPAAMLVPLLRPMLPMQAHLAASVCSNDLVIVDTAANVRRIESLVQSLDRGEPYEPRDCAVPRSSASESKEP